MSSHLLGEVEQLADRVGIVNAGILVEEIDCRELRATSQSAVEVEVDDPERALRVLREELGMSDMTRSGPSSLRIADAGAEPSRIARELVGAGIALERLVKSEEDLETHFMRLTGGTA
jgi:ABC-type multidrug transport system ATPase subunit